MENRCYRKQSPGSISKPSDFSDMNPLLLRHVPGEKSMGKHHNSDCDKIKKQVSYKEGMYPVSLLAISTNKKGVSLKEDELGIDHWELWLFRLIGWNLS